MLHFVKLCARIFSTTIDLFRDRNLLAEILKKERDIAQKRYGEECYERLKETLAFGSRVPTTESSVSGGEVVSVRGVKSPQWVQPGNNII